MGGGMPINRLAYLGHVKERRAVIIFLGENIFSELLYSHAEVLFAAENLYELNRITERALQAFRDAVPSLDMEKEGIRPELEEEGVVFYTALTPVRPSICEEAEESYTVAAAVLEPA